MPISVSFEVYRQHRSLLKVERPDEMYSLGQIWMIQLASGLQLSLRSSRWKLTLNIMVSTDMKLFGEWHTQTHRLN